MIDRSQIHQVSMAWPDGVPLDELTSELHRLAGQTLPASAIHDDDPMMAVSAYWHGVLTGLDNASADGWRSVPNDTRYVGLRVCCPGCGKKLVLLGLDRDRVHAGSDQVWFKTYRRVSLQWKPLFESREEGRYTAEQRIDIACPVPNCRGNVELRLDRLVVAMHRLRNKGRDNTPKSIVCDYVP